MLSWCLCRPRDGLLGPFRFFPLRPLETPGPAPTGPDPLPLRKGRMEAAVGPLFGHPFAPTTHLSVWWTVTGRKGSRGPDVTPLPKIPRPLSRHPTESYL